MRSSGHESFCCRYTWLPKAFSALAENPRLFTDEEAAMVKLGLGKNMVRSLRFWVQAFGVAKPSPASSNDLIPTHFGSFVFGTDGVDPYLEDIRTLWLLHWNLATQSNAMLAWDELLFRWPSGEFSRSDALTRFSEQAKALNMRASKRTLKQHLEIFLSTYLVAEDDAKAKKVLEDSLDCPLTELGLIRTSGQKCHTSGTREVVYAFRHEPKPDISAHLFAHCLWEFWQTHHGQEQTVTLQQITNGYGSPGKVFRLPESDIRARLERANADSSGYFIYLESVNLQQIRRRDGNEPAFLSAIYGHQAVHG